METSFHNVDPSHHLKLEILLHGFKPAVLNFPRNETFCKMAKFAGAKFSLSEIVAFYTDSSNGSSVIVIVSVECNFMLSRIVDGIGFTLF